MHRFAPRCYAREFTTWPEVERRSLRGDLLARSAVEHEPNPLVGSPCRVWLGERTTDGYGIFRRKGERFRAHRLALVAEGVFDSPGLVVDHVCRNPGCVEVTHLRLVSQRENVLTGTSPAAANAAKFACDRGHLFAGANLYRHPAGYRRCRICHRFHTRRYRALAKVMSA